MPRHRRSSDPTGANGSDGPRGSRMPASSTSITLPERRTGAFSTWMVPSATTPSAVRSMVATPPTSSSTLSPTTWSEPRVRWKRREVGQPTSDRPVGFDELDADGPPRLHGAVRVGLFGPGPFQGADVAGPEVGEHQQQRGGGPGDLLPAVPVVLGGQVDLEGAVGPPDEVADHHRPLPLGLGQRRADRVVH